MSRENANPNSGGLPPAQALVVANLVDYASSAVVSRTIVKSKGCVLTLFAFDAGQELSEHSTPYDAYVHVLDGAVELTIGGETVRTVAGQVVRMPADVPHAVVAVERFKMLLIMVRG
jgi:quercetin dioxygenase-like cupin family protein